MTRTERHRVSDFSYIVTTQSSVVQGEEIHERRFRCPICGTDHDRPEHGIRERCRNRCGASWTARGNRLDLEYDGPETSQSDPLLLAGRRTP